MAGLADFLPNNSDSESAEETPMQRRTAQNAQDPMSLVHQGIMHLNDPNNGLDYDQKMEAIVPLLQAKHFQGPPPPNLGSSDPGSQGSIEVKDTMNHGILGFFNKLTSGSGAATKLGILNSSAGAGSGASAGATYAAADAGAGAGGVSAGSDALFAL